ncbi:MAG: outer membrane lipoprotein carrier protein LolA, partial [Alphaproteobacteria bacterium]|nr:outer membrane lipoprotein carrier protein LolA [Alphaproteobacteria bacterium]
MARGGAALALVALVAVGVPITSPAAKPLSQQDKADIALVTEYLNQVKSLEAEFIQAGPNGEFAKGRLFMQRPNRLRFEYDPPSPLLLVADGLWLILHDRELDQVDRWPVKDTPLGVLVADE